MIFGPSDLQTHRDLRYGFALQSSFWLGLVSFKDIFPISRFRKAKHRRLQQMLIFHSSFTKVYGDKEPGCFK